MPTGYTCKLMEEGQDFKTFAFTCARAFGPCVSIRDEESGPAPKKLVNKNDGYYQRQLKESKRELKKLLAMSDKEKEDMGWVLKNNNLIGYKESLRKYKLENKRIDEMLDKVWAWQPPTRDHFGLKEFMINQLKLSRNSIDGIEASIAEIQASSDISYYNAKLESVKGHIESCEEHIKGEAKTLEKANEWLTQLHRSIK